MMNHHKSTCSVDCDDYDHECRDSCNVYSSPENHGVRLLEVASKSGLSYRYNMAILVEELTTKNQYFARDSGCSCPAPFEKFKNVQDMTPLRGHEAEYRDMVRDVKAPYYNYDSGRYQYEPHEDDDEE